MRAVRSRQRSLEKRGDGQEAKGRDDETSEASARRVVPDTCCREQGRAAACGRESASGDSNARAEAARKAGSCRHVALAIRFRRWGIFIRGVSATGGQGQRDAAPPEGRGQAYVFAKSSQGGGGDRTRSSAAGKRSEHQRRKSRPGVGREEGRPDSTAGRAGQRGQAAGRLGSRCHVPAGA